MIEEKREQEPTPTHREVTGWYVPHRIGAKEVVEMYVREEEYPRRARPRPQMRPRRRGKWVLLTVVALIVALVSAGVVLRFTGAPGPGAPDPEGGDASSIVDIFGEDEVAIPRAEPAPHVRLSLLDRDTVLTPQEVYTRVAGATVMVLADRGDGTSSVGTGVIFTSDGYIVTNAHVIAGAEAAAVVVMGSYLYEAELVGYDVDADLAVLKAVDAQGFPTAEFADSYGCRVGDTVYAIGNPLGVELQGTFTDGMISAVNRDVELDGRTVNTLQFTAAINSGNSGGPLINDCGQVIGINTLKMSNSHLFENEATIEGLGFAIPSAEVFFVVNDILATGEYRGAPTFGMTVAERYTGEADGTQLEIYSVENGGGAFNAALEPGDVILAVDGAPVATIRELQQLRREHLPEDVVIVTVRRGTEIFDAEVTLYADR